MVTHNFNSKIVAPEDLSTFTPLRVGSIFSKLHVPFCGTAATLRLFLNEMFMGVTESSSDEGADGMACVTFGLHSNQVRILKRKKKTLHGKISKQTWLMASLLFLYR
jgi:hypothetical protein